MLRIRLNVLYVYYVETLKELVNACCVIRDDFSCGRISYKRAWAKLNRLIKTAWQRVRLCENLATQMGRFETPHRHHEELLKEITRWTTM